MKRILLSFLIGSASFFSMGQIAVTGISPASVEGNYNFNLALATQGWVPALDFNTPGVYIQDTLVMVEDGTPGTNPQGNPISQEGCGPLTNASSVAGKIAVVYRNTCEFGMKALHAQNAGAIAVIIINRDPEAVGMAAGTSGSTVSIPVLMISSIDGQTLTNAMQDGPVVMFIGNKAGLHPNDLALNEDLILVPKFHGVHSLLAQDGSEFNMDLGMRVFNFGSANQTDATANAKITGPGATVVYDQTVTFSLDGVSGNVIDSVDIFPGEALSFPQFSLATYPAGEYKLEYTLALSAGADDFASDNYYTVNFVVNNSMISRSRLDPNTLLPIASTQVAASDPPSPASPYTELHYCFTFVDPNASRLAALGLHASASIDTAVAPSLIGKSVFFEIFEWNDPFTNYTDPGFGYTQVVSQAFAEHSFENDVTQENIYFQLEEPLLLEDNQKYLVCIVNRAEPIRFGYDNAVDFNGTIQHYGMLTNPLYASPNSNPSPWFGGGFGPDLTPAFALHAVDVATASVGSLLSLEGKAYPNPSSDEVRMIISLDGKAVVSVTDLAGRTVSTHDVTFMSNQASISIADLQTGMYVINVAYENGSKSTFNVVKK